MTKYNANYLYKADIVFVEVSSGVYTVGKSYLGNYRPSQFIGAETVVSEMQRLDIKVVICKDSMETIVTGNF